MLSRAAWILVRMARLLWLRTLLIGVFAVAVVPLSILLSPMIPASLARLSGALAVDRILDILASSMLAVTTFSLSVMVAAYGFASNHVTPRAARLLNEDPITQTVLATFVGVFLFSMVGVASLSTGIYDDRGRVVLYAATLAMIVFMIIALLRWVAHLTSFGKVEDSIDKVVEATREALKRWMQTPSLGARPLRDPESGVPEDVTAVRPPRSGYVQHIDVVALSRLADRREGEIYVVAPPGAFVQADAPVAWLRDIHGDCTREVLAAFVIGDRRTFEQDPRFGLIVLAEIGGRALSPGINDPGTAIDVLGQALGLLEPWTRQQDRPDNLPCRFQRLWVPPLEPHDLLWDVFAPIARDGAGFLEVQLRLRRVLAALARSGSAEVAEAAEELARIAMARAERALTIPEELQMLREVPVGAEQ